MSNKLMIPDALQQAIKNNTLVIFVGAGFSAGLGFPNWNELIKQILRKTFSNDEKKLNAFLTNLDIEILSALDVLDKIEKYASGTAFDVLEQALKLTGESKQKIAQDEKFQLLWELCPRIITTNYDQALETAAQLDSDEIVVYSAQNSIKNLSKKSKYLFKIHGDITDSAQCVLFRSKYDQLYQEETSPIFELKKLIADQCILFVGFSLSDPYVTEIFQYINKLYHGLKGKQHFALTTADNDFSPYGVENIKLDSYAGIPPYLKQLLTYKPHILPDAPVVTLTQPEIKAAVLIAQPIAENVDYSEALRELKKIKCRLDVLPLSVAVLNALEGYQYIFVFSRIIKDRIQIEGEYLEARTLSFNELDAAIGNDDPHGLFIFVDQAVNAEQCQALSYPTAIYSEAGKNLIGSVLFKAFKKLEAPTTSSACLVFNSEKWCLTKLQSNHQTCEFISPLAKEIDRKALGNFVGRSTDQKNIVRDIITLQDEGGVLTIKGSGGIGKTQTVKKVALLLAERHFFKEGIYFVDCEFLTVFKLFESRLFEPFNLEQAQDAKAHLKQHYHKQSILIILDNFETLLHQTDAEKYIELLGFVCDYATVVLTSRELLEQSWEKAYELNRMSTDEAEQLFLQGIAERKFNPAQKKLLREDIIENLLDSNPLAIRLITRSMPKGKDLEALKAELIQDFFSKVSEQELLAFDSASDNNIEKKRSLYGCINYSYALLNPKEQLAFEIMSLFPDGISLEDLKKVSQQQLDDFKSDRKTAYQHNLITDIVIKGLENKSMIESREGHFKLQSIMGKFAEQKLQQRKDIAEIYKNAFEYNRMLADIGCSLARKNENSGEAFMAYWQNNFVRCIGYLDKFECEQDSLVDFLVDIKPTFVHTCRESIMLNSMMRQRQIFTKNNLMLFDLIVIFLRYFRGDFDSAFAELQQIMPMSQLENYSGEDATSRMIVLTAINLYSMEGEDYFALKQLYRLESWNSGYPDELVCLGEYNQTLLDLVRPSFFSFEFTLNSAHFSLTKLDNYLAKLHKKAHLERMQLNYIKVKAGHFVKDEITKLVEVNPYTTGLKQLMFALHEPDVTQAKSLYQNAAENLKHIKYYYVEALYFYARFLQQNGNDLYEEIYQLGFSLATKYWFRFLIYQFESLTSQKSQPYNKQDYPLHEDMREQVDGYIQFCIKKLLEAK